MVEKVVRQFTEVETVVTKLGRPDLATEAMGIYQGDVYVILKPLEQWTTVKTKDELIEALDARLKDIPGVVYNFTQPLAMRLDEVISGVKADVAVKLFGDDPDVLQREAGLRTKTIFGSERTNKFLLETTGCGCAFIDYDNDGWPDIFICNGHVYPEVGETDPESGYRERKVLYRNKGNGTFTDVSLAAGAGVLEKVPGRGCAFGDFDNDGDIDVLVNCVNDMPQLLRCDQLLRNNWLKVKTIGVKSNRSGIGARIYCSTGGGHRQMDEVRSGGSYISQNDLRVHFGLGKATNAEIEVRWPSGIIDRFRAAANQVIKVIEGKGMRS